MQRSCVVVRPGGATLTTSVHVHTCCRPPLALVTHIGTRGAEPRQSHAVGCAGSSLRGSDAGISGGGDNQGFGLVSLLPNCLCRYFLLGAAVWKKQVCVAVTVTRSCSHSSTCPDVFKRSLVCFYYFFFFFVFQAVQIFGAASTITNK